MKYVIFDRDNTVGDLEIADPSSLNPGIINMVRQLQRNGYTCILATEAFSMYFDDVHIPAGIDNLFDACLGLPEIGTDRKKDLSLLCNHFPRDILTNSVMVGNARDARGLVPEIPLLVVNSTSLEHWYTDEAYAVIEALFSKEPAQKFDRLFAGGSPTEPKSLHRSYDAQSAVEATINSIDCTMQYGRSLKPPRRSKSMRVQDFLRRRDHRLRRLVLLDVYDKFRGRQRVS